MSTTRSPANSPPTGRKHHRHNPADNIIELDSEGNVIGVIDGRTANRILGSPFREIIELDSDGEVIQEVMELLSEDDIDMVETGLEDFEVAPITIATATVPVAVADIRDILECAICREGQKTSMMIPTCGHSFCAKCLVTWFKKTAKKMYEKKKRGEPVMKYFRCPSCNQDVKRRPVPNYMIRYIMGLLPTIAIQQFGLEATNGEWDTTREFKSLWFYFDDMNL